MMTIDKGQKFNDFILKPSEALMYMVEGIKTQVSEPRCELNMRTYLNSRVGDDGLTICISCAATCAIQKIYGTKFPLTNHATTVKDKMWHGFNYAYMEHERFSTFGHISRQDYTDFEAAMDKARGGELFELFKYLDMEWMHNAKYDWRFSIGDGVWADDLILAECERVEQCIEELEFDGL